MGMDLKELNITLRKLTNIQWNRNPNRRDYFTPATLRKASQQVALKVECIIIDVVSPYIQYHTWDDHF